MAPSQKHKRKKGTQTTTNKGVAASEAIDESSSIEKTTKQKKKKKKKRKVGGAKEEKQLDSESGALATTDTNLTQSTATQNTPSKKQTKRRKKKGQSPAPKRPKTAKGSALEFKTKSDGAPQAGSRHWCDVRPVLKTLASIEKLGFPRMTPVQAATLPLFLAHKDVAVQACTGSGKTLGFVIPIVEILLRRHERLKTHQVGALVISPTRELATQTFSVFEHFTNDFPHLILTGTIGGLGNEENFALQGGNIVIATPGRLDRMLRTSSFDVRELEVLVLDEADRLLDMGFENAITAILKLLPKQRRTGLFSATQTKEVKALARAGLRNPTSIVVKVMYKQGAEGTAAAAAASQAQESITPASLTNYYTVCPPQDKLSCLVHFLQTEVKGGRKAIVFFLTCAAVDYMVKVLPFLSQLSGLPIWGLHGKMPQKRRSATFAAFTKAETGILLSTDVAARGLDVPDLDWIAQYDPPQDPSFFVHRIGRTARMGRKGQALVFLLPQEDTYVQFLQNKKVPIQERDCWQGRTKDDKLDVLPQVHKLALADRGVMEKAQSAFVSFVRAYREHQCSFIFVFSKLPFTHLARGAFGCLYMPKLPDIKHIQTSDWVPVTTVRPRDIKFKDKHREKQRLSNAGKKKQKRIEEQEERERLKKARIKAKAKAKPKRRAKKLNAEITAEWKELQNEEKLYKKLKSGRISQEEFDEAVGNATFDK